LPVDVNRPEKPISQRWWQTADWKTRQPIKTLLYLSICPRTIQGPPGISDWEAIATQHAAIQHLLRLSSCEGLPVLAIAQKYDECLHHIRQGDMDKADAVVLVNLPSTVNVAGHRSLTHGDAMA
jgi:hypothetical protein